MAVEGLSSTLTLTKLTSSRASDISSRIGETRRHGTHHGAQKSTMTGLSARRTSLSKVASVTSATAIISDLHTLLEARFAAHSSTREKASGIRLQTSGKLETRGLVTGPYGCRQDNGTSHPSRVPADFVDSRFRGSDGCGRASLCPQSRLDLYKRTRKHA